MGLADGGPDGRWSDRRGPPVRLLPTGQFGGSAAGWLVHQPIRDHLFRYVACLGYVWPLLKLLRGAS